MRTLNLDSTGSGLTSEDPVVVESGDSRSVATDLSLDDEYLNYSVDGEEQQVPHSGFTVAPDGTTISVGDHTVRRLTDQDGLWASSTQGSAPMDSLEQLALGGPYMPDASPFGNLDESLWAALDDETGELKELVYSSPAGLYVRDSGGWFKSPDDDDSLDGMESIDVNGDFVDVFDAAQIKGTLPTRDQVMQYEIPDDDNDTSDDETTETDTPDEE